MYELCSRQGWTEISADRCGTDGLMDNAKTISPPPVGRGQKPVKPVTSYHSDMV